MSPANKVNSELTRRLYNPLLLVNGLNFIPESNPLSKTEELAQIKALYEKALEETSTNNLVYGLNVDYSDDDCGLGGFYSSGFVGYFCSEYDGQDTDKIQKNLNFYWPKVPNSDKFMSYLGSINLGIWPLLFSHLTRRKFEKTSWASFWDWSGIDRNRDFLIMNLEHDYWMHLFVGEKNDFTTTVPDCHVRITRQFNAAACQKDSRDGIHQDWYNAVREWQETKTVKSSVVAPKKYFGKITPKIMFDGLSMPRKYEITDPPKGSIFEHDLPDCQIYGAPWSQQTPKRYVSPEGYFWRGCAPMFAFYDDGDDMTHQFYADSIVMDSINHTRYYCKLDSSCT